MAALVAQQALIVLVAGQDVDDVPEAGPAFEAAELHVGGNQAGGSADGHVLKFRKPDSLTAAELRTGWYDRVTSAHFVIRFHKTISSLNR